MRLRSPLLGYELEDGEPFEHLEALGEVVGVGERLQMLTQVLMALVVIAPDGGVLNGPVHALDLTVGPWMVRFGLVRRWSMPFCAHASAKAWQRKQALSASSRLISAAVQPSPLGL